MEDTETPYVPYEYVEGAANKSWAGTLPIKQGLYDPEYEKDACGVGFACNIKGEVSHKIISDAQLVLCNMTHRGAVGADARDGDGAGVMTSIPHKFMTKEFKFLGVDLPPQGQYAVGNVFFSKSPDVAANSIATFERIAKSLGMRILGWREVPRDSTLLGPAALSREPLIMQPVAVLDNVPVCSDEEFEQKYAKLFARQLYVLRKQSTHTIGINNWFYICSFTNKNIVYKGQLSPVQVYKYYYDLLNVDYEGHFALVHSRFSTNTFPSWDRAQPLRWAAHNGEINTLRGNKNWMRAREGVMKSKEFGDVLDQLYPIIEEGGSDSAAFDNVLELLLINGVLSLPEAVMLMVPEAWQNNKEIDSKKRAFYEWAACLMEPWDGPALFTFADGRYCGANLDRNGLRPCRYYVTDDNRMICASEVGVLPIDSSIVVQKGRLQPGRMLLVDTVLGKIVDDRELKKKVGERFDFKSWLSANLIDMKDLLHRAHKKGIDLTVNKDPNTDMTTTVQTDPRIKAFGYTFEQVSAVLAPMAREGKEPLGSMGNDVGLACLTNEPKLIYQYFRQLFAQVTNPPIDPIRESIVMSLECYVGTQGNMLDMNPLQCNRFHLKSPILTIEEMNAIRTLPTFYPTWTIANIDITFDRSEGVNGYTAALDRICQEALQSVANQNKVIVLTDRGCNKDRVAISTLLAASAVHHFLVSQKERSKIALFVETGEAREVHHICVLLGYGVDGICPYLALETLIKMNHEGLIGEDLSDIKVIANYKKSIDEGILKVMAKMGISTLASYKGAQIFEILGIDNSVVDKCFTGTASRIQGVNFENLAADALAFHLRGFPLHNHQVVEPNTLPESGEYHWRAGGLPHVNNPGAIADLQDAVRNKNKKAYESYAANEHKAIGECTLRGLLSFDFENSTEISIDQVEPWTEIVRRFVTGAMSYGSISMESHSTLAVAMNRIGAKSNTGEGGEDPERSFVNAETGDTMRSAIKQVASGRFGVTSLYLSDADELQIKMAQGAKPGEGGELPGHKVSKSIARTRHSTKNVGLISPPPHHDIYSIEDLKQLIYDLKCSNPRARVSVKLVSEVGVGIIASGVAKAKADHILISGHDGGTGASRLTGIKYAGLPWELGLAETHQTLVLNDLRGRVTLQTDGQIRTGRDVAIACLLGAEEWGFATTPLIAMGCIMMRKCHLNTCPVGIATQDPDLRKKFEGTPEHVINFFYYVAQELRGIMAKLGFRSVDEMVGHAEKLKVSENAKLKKIDLSPLLTPAHSLRPGVATRKVRNQDHRLHVRLDNKLIDEAELTLEHGLPAKIQCEIINTDRAMGTTLSYRISKRFGEQGLPDDTVHVDVSGNAGQSFGAFLAPGITLELEGDANDYVGKGLSGGRIIIYPPQNSPFNSEENILIGNTCLYGATSGSCFFSGIAAERFAVRNSGATAVVEGVGDHGCEYMTGGRVVVLGSTGRNFAAGMSGGIAYVLDVAQEFSANINKAQVELTQVVSPTEIAFLRGLIEDHRHFTGSKVAERVLKDFNRILPLFVKVLPLDYKKVLEEESQKKRNEKQREIGGYMRPYKEDPSADATNGEVLRMQKSSLALKDMVVDPPQINPEPEVQDVEDTIKESNTTAVKKLDKLRGFKLYRRRNETYRNPSTRTQDWNEVSHRLSKHELAFQTARCMDCGTPFCQSDYGCPVSNIIPKFNELVFKNRWYDALQRLLMTNNFPEFTGRVCPAPCEGACVLGISEDPVGIKSVEAAIIDHGFEQGWIKPYECTFSTNKTVAVVGSGPAGLACADQLNRAGHKVTVYERNDRFGGLLMYGIPNMKLDKRIVQRRIDLLEQSGITFVNNTAIGVDISLNELKSSFDAVVMTVGSTIPRDLPVPGRSLNNIKFAMELLEWNTKALLQQELPEVREFLADKKVVVIGGGDTGNDCLGTAVRHSAKSVINFELLPKPANTRARDNPWPQWPLIFRVDYGHSEVSTHYGQDPREYCILSKEFVGDDEGNVVGIKTVRVEWKRSASGAWQMSEVPGSDEFFEADVVLLSMGFVGPECDNFSELPRDARGNFKATETDYLLEDNVFAAGDCRRGQSLIVWGIQEGRKCARSVDIHLTGSSDLPGDGSIVPRETCSK